MRLESRAFLVDRAPRGETEHLVAAAVGQNGLLPSDKGVQTAAPRDEIVAGPQVEMVRVAEQDVRADILEIAMGDRLDGALGTHGHERRRRDLAVRGAHHPGACSAVGACDAEREGRRRHQKRVYNLRRDADFTTTTRSTRTLCG